MVKRHLFPTYLHYLLFCARSSHKLKAEYFFFLADPMSSRESLYVLVGIEVRIKNYDRIRSRKVDANASRSRGKKESKQRGVRSVELVNTLLLLQTAQCTVQALVLETQPI